MTDSKQLFNYIRKGNFSEYFFILAKNKFTFSPEAIRNAFQKEIYPYYLKNKTTIRSQLVSALLSGLLHLFFQKNDYVLYVAVTIFEVEKNAENEKISPFEIVNFELEKYVKQLVQIRLKNIDNESKYKLFLTKWAFS